jgi:hypothetical protein
MAKGVTSRSSAARLGKMRTTRVCRFSSWLSRYRPLVVRTRTRWAEGTAERARQGSRSSSSWAATAGWLARHRLYLFFLVIGLIFCQYPG